MAHSATLTNTIHPSVSKEKFTDDVDYDAVFLQPARLASNLLRSPQAVHYFMAMIDSAPHLSELTEDLTDTVRCFYYELENVHALRPMDYIRVERKLKHVAETVTWGVSDMTACGVQTALPRGCCARSSLSLRSKIDINKRLYQALARMQEGRKKLSLQFLLAVTIVHELAHATMYALTETPHEHVFRQMGSGEAGWEIEARLFGLCPHDKDKFSGDLWWYELAKGQKQHLQPNPVEPVQIGFIQDLFADWFWLRFWDRQFQAPLAWTIIPSAAWPPMVYVPDSVLSLIQTATAYIRRRLIADVEIPSRKRKRHDDGDREEVITTDG